tara:strand:+ start:2030 stop:3184 length:1155 start_codon:yes stop_codon:yes gene_type:complete
MSQKYIVNNNKVYEVNDQALFTTFKELTVPEHDVVPIWKGKKIPLSMWKTIVKFCKHSYDELKSETLIYLFYDETKNQPWSYWVPPQITNGMTVRSNPNHPAWKEQRAQYPDTMFGTVHHHCSTSAFQSGTDEADETKREGLHFTIGKLDSDTDVDVHFRMTIGQMHSEIDAHLYIEMNTDPFKRNCYVPKEQQLSIREQLHKLDIRTILNKDIDFTNEMTNVEKPTVVPVTQSKFDESWHLGRYDDSYYSSKKNEHANSNCDVQIIGEDFVEEFIQTVFFDPDYEEILIDYYSNRNNSNKLLDYQAGNVYDTDLAKELYKALTDEQYKEEFPFNAQKNDLLVKQFLESQRSYGLDFTQNDLIYGLNNYEDREGFQCLDKEELL